MHQGLTRRQFLAVAGGGLAAAGAATVYGAQSNQLEVVHTSACAAPIEGGIRVALASDMHAPHELVGDREMADAIAAFDPHFVFILGDSIERAGDESLVRFYDRLSARVAKYAVLGNWEYWGACDFRVLGREYERGNVRLLVNQSVVHEVNGRRIEIAGLDDARTSRQEYGLVRRLTPDADVVRLVLSHCPGPFDRIASESPAPVITFSGHTHGGQIAPFGFAPILPEGSGPYVAGWYHAGASHLYVTRGLGNSGVPLRIGSRPEVTLLQV